MIVTLDHQNIAIQMATMIHIIMHIITLSQFSPPWIER